jgi:hypothetical protein
LTEEMRRQLVYFIQTKELELARHKQGAWRTFDKTFLSLKGLSARLFPL